jgi:hypothetical protein
MSSKHYLAGLPELLNRWKTIKIEYDMRSWISVSSRPKKLAAYAFEIEL